MRSMIIISSAGDNQCKKTGKLLGLIDMTINRNASAARKDSFEKELDIKDIESKRHILRAPAVTEVRDKDAEILAKSAKKS